MTDEFDQYAHGYNQSLNDVVGVVGDDASYFHEYKARYLVRALNSKTPQKILDFGCGVGNITSYIKQARPDWTVHGFDPSEESIKRVEPALAAQGLFTHKKAALNHDYDAILVANVLHHVPVESRAAFIQDLKQYLATHGCLVIVEHNPLNPGSRWVVKTCVFDKGVIMVWKHKAERYLKEAGFSFVKKDFVVFFPKFLSWFRPLEKWLGWCPLGAQYALVAKK